MVRVPSPPQIRSQAVMCVSTPRMYPRSGYFLVIIMDICKHGQTNMKVEKVNYNGHIFVYNTHRISNGQSKRSILMDHFSKGVVVKKQWLIFFPFFTEKLGSREIQLIYQDVCQSSHSSIFIPTLNILGSRGFQRTKIFCLVRKLQKSTKMLFQIKN